MTKKLIIKLVLIFSISINSFADDSAPTSPADVIEQFHNALLSVMKNAESLGYQGRHNEFSGLIPDRFNIPLIAQVILGRHWTGLNENQKVEFTSLYKNLIIATYSERFDSYNGENFHTKSTEDLNRGRVLVKTVLTKTDGESISLDYLMSQSDNNWMIISVIADGANDISIKRGEYSDVIKINGYDALLTQIQNKIIDASQ